MLALFSRFRRPGWNWCCGGEPAGVEPRGPGCAWAAPSAKLKKVRPLPARPSEVLLEDDDEQPGLSVPDSALDDDEDDDDSDGDLCKRLALSAAGPSAVSSAGGSAADGRTGLGRAPVRADGRGRRSVGRAAQLRSRWLRRRGEGEGAAAAAA